MTTILVHLLEYKVSTEQQIANYFSFFFSYLIRYTDSRHGNKQALEAENNMKIDCKMRRVCWTLSSWFTCTLILSPFTRICFIYLVFYTQLPLNSFIFLSQCLFSPWKFLLPLTHFTTLLRNRKMIVKKQNAKR